MNVPPDADRVIPRKQVVSWAMWDWATQPFNSVLLTFVFAPLYLVSANFLPRMSPRRTRMTRWSARAVRMPRPNTAAGWPTCRPGTAGRPSSRGSSSCCSHRCSASERMSPATRSAGSSVRRGARAHPVRAVLRPADPAFFWFGAARSRSARSSPRSPASTTTRCSSRSRRRAPSAGSAAWAGVSGYIGGIVLVLVVRRLLNARRLVRRDTAERAGLRVSWSSPRCGRRVRHPLRVQRARDQPRAPTARRSASSPLRAARSATSRALFREHRPTFWFLIASAVYRDGLAGVFAFGGVLAAVAFGFSPSEVILFGIAVNLVAGVVDHHRRPPRRPVRRRARHRRRRSIDPDRQRPVRLLLPRAGQDDLLDRRHHPLPLRRARRRHPAARSSPASSRPAAGRDLRSVRDDRPGDELPLAAAVRAVHRDGSARRTGGSSASRSCCARPRAAYAGEGVAAAAALTPRSGSARGQPLVDAVASGAADRTSGVWFRCTTRVNSSTVLASSTSGKRCATLRAHRRIGGAEREHHREPEADDDERVEVEDAHRHESRPLLLAQLRPRRVEHEVVHTPTPNGGREHDRREKRTRPATAEQRRTPTPGRCANAADDSPPPCSIAVVARQASE